MTAEPSGSLPPAVVRTRADLWDARWRLPGTVGLVPTMGALHEGHVALLREARRRADSVVVSIFVNALQFGPGEDFERYPRPFDDDLAVCAREGADLVFAPPTEEMYAAGEPQVRVVTGPLGERLEGSSRPGHFDGVLTVVTKLLHLTQPTFAVFGEKDAQQLALVQRLVADLDFPVRIVPVPIVREPDGLALSSRNRYLTAEQRRQALALHRALEAGVARAPDGVSAVLDAARDVLRGEPGVRLDYLRLLAPDFADVPVAYRGPARLLVAGYLGTTRLLDNASLVVGEAPAPITPETR